MTKVTREEWLQECSILIYDEIVNKHDPSRLPNWKIGVGFPSRPKAIGQSWSPEAALDEITSHIVISPILGNQDVVNLLQVLLHEILHSVAGHECKHGGEFKRLARACGLEGKLTATYVSPNTPLADQLYSIASRVQTKLGTTYPHSEIVLKPKDTKERAKNYVWAASVNDPQFKVKVKKDVLESYGLPFDAEGEQMEIVEE